MPELLIFLEIRFKVGNFSTPTTTRPLKYPSPTASTNLSDSVSNELDETDPITSETLSTGISIISGGVDTLRGFLMDMFRGFIETLASFFGGSGRGGGGGGNIGGDTPLSTSSGNTPAASVSSTKNQTYFRIQLGPKKSTSLAEVPKISPVVGNEVSKLTS